MMANDELWTAPEENLFEQKSSGISALRISMLFACGAIALALVVTPMVAGDASNQITYFQDGVFDDLTTSSVNGSVDGAEGVSGRKEHQPFPNNLNGQGSGSNTYTVRRSVTQTTNQSCIIYSNGLKTSGCD